jgi:DNA-binding transcriptional MerR regulator
MKALRIRTVARLTGVREGTLRAWERRHGFPRPSRSANNYRTYSEEDVEAVRRVSRLVSVGCSVGEAIEQVQGQLASAQGATEESQALQRLLKDWSSDKAKASPSLREVLIDRFWDAARILDTVEMERVLSEAQNVMPPTQLCDDFLLLLLRSMSEVLNVACEHVGSALVRHRLRAVVQAMGAPSPDAPRVLLAGPPGERHEGGLLALSVHLRQRGWNPLVLGPDLPIDALLDAAERVRPSLIALSFVRRPPEREMDAYLRKLATGTSVPIAVGGDGTRGRESLIRAAGARCVTSPEALLDLKSSA